MRLRLWIPYPLISFEVVGPYSTYLSVPIGRVDVDIRRIRSVEKVAKEVLEVANAIEDYIGLPKSIPLSDLTKLPKVVQLVVCTQASLSSISSSLRDLIKLAIYESEVLEADPGLLVALHCCAKYGVPCIARAEECVRSAVKVPLRVSPSETRVVGKKGVYELDSYIANLIRKLVSYTIMKIVNADSCGEAMKYLNLYSLLVKWFTGVELGGIASVTPWIGGVFELSLAEVVCIDARCC